MRKVLKVGICGLPNAGKSTLVNMLCGKKVSAVSPKAQTTRNPVLAVLSEGEVQLQLVDTPGIIPWEMKREIKWEKRAALQGVFVQTTKHMLREDEKVDAYVYVVDAVAALRVKKQAMVYQSMKDIDIAWKRSSGINRSNSNNGIVDSSNLNGENSNIASDNNTSNVINNNDDAAGNKEGLRKKDDAVKLPEITEEDRKNSKNILVLNKIDYLSSITKATPLSYKMNQLAAFKDTFMVSAKYGTGVNELLQALLDMAVPGEWEYEPSHTSTVNNNNNNYNNDNNHNHDNNNDNIEKKKDEYDWRINYPDIETLIHESVREVLYKCLNKEVPYVITQETEEVTFIKKKKLVEIHHNIIVARESMQGMVIGEKGRNISHIKEDAARTISTIIGQKVYLKLNVKVAKKKKA